MQRVETNSNSSGWNVSANIGMRTGGLVGWSASAYKGTENGIEDTTTHTGTHVVGSNKVSITSGNDTNLTGSTISNAILVEVERKPFTAINRDTEHALNSIKPIFDKADVKERMEYVNAVSDEGFKLIGDIAMKQAQKDLQYLVLTRRW